MTTTDGCHDRGRMLGSYLDGELDGPQLIDIGEHVAVCEPCREQTQLLRAMRGSLKRVVQTAAPSGLRERIGAAMVAERAREQARVDGEEGTGDPRAPAAAPWQTIVPLATAAAIALMWGAAARVAQPPMHEARAGLGDDLLGELVAEHSQPLPLEATSAQDVRRLVERWVGVPVRPASFERAGARLEGGRVLPVRGQRAAMLQYLVGSGEDARRVSVIVYDAQKIQVGTSGLAPRAVGAAEVRVGRQKGYSVAATQRAGEGYVVASDLNPDETAQLAAMVYDDR